jgi:Fe-S-cluster containining protein
MSKKPIDPARLIPVEQLPALRQQAEQQAFVNVGRLNAKSRAAARLGDAAMEIAKLPLSQRIRYNKLVKLVDQASEAILPFTACRKGCSHCCHIAALISDVEAQRIGEAIGRKPVKTGAFPADVPALQDKYFGVPCTFLKGGRCSIYEVRPLACRLHFSMADDSFFCSTAIAPQNSLVPTLNLQGVDAALFRVTFGSMHADIRDFFPKR